eukprot:Gb_17807 [translate_table: standard]
MTPAIMASQVASGIGMIAGAWMFKSLMEAEEHKAMLGVMPRCPSCNGSKRVPCICKRWSDGDQGCATCDRTGMRRCSSCGGSGTGRAIPVKIRISNRQKKF